jgi:hypothetical protein
MPTIRIIVSLNNPFPPIIYNLHKFGILEIKAINLLRDLKYDLKKQV